jgi:membrane-associated protease RseP (regulator of RpoE activity)
MITSLMLLVALGILAWGFNRSRPLGKFGIFAWLQSVSLMAPWLLFFGLFTAGIYLNLVGILFLVVGSIALYIYLGRQLRAMAMDQDLMKQVNAMAAAADAKRAGKMAANATGTNATRTNSTGMNSEDANSTDANSGASSTDATQVSQGGEGTSAVPQTVIAPELSPIPEADLQTMRGIFGIDTFFATETIPYQNGAIFRGNLRGEPEATHTRLSQSLHDCLGDRYRLYLIESPEGRPVVVVLPQANDPKPATLFQKILSIVLAIATFATCCETAGILQSFDFFTQPQRYAEVLPIGLPLLGILAAHEVGHHIFARRHNIQLSPPFFLPSSQIGAFGVFNRFESILPNRSVLFDVAFAGAAIGGVLSFTLLVLGLILSHPGSPFQLPAEFLQASILVGTLSRVILGDAVQQTVVDIHPLVVVGWLGLIITAINLLPAGQLDGGRIVLAIYGRKTARVTTIATLIILGIGSLVSPLALYWAILVLFLQRDLERPALNELTEPDDARAALGILALFLMAATLLPLTPTLAGRLGIGG